MNRKREISFLRRLRRDRHGAAAIEFAFIAPILFAVIFGTIDLGSYAWTLSTIQNAADEAARQGGVRGFTVAQVQTEAQNNLFAQNLSNFVITPTYTTISGVNYLQVQITHSYNFMFPISIVYPTGNMSVTARFPV